MTEAASTAEIARASEQAPPEMAVSYTRVAKNAGIYFCAQIISWVVSLLTISIIPRTLGETAMGQLAVLGAAFGPGGTLLGMGLESHLTREVGRDPGQTERLIRACIGLRIVMHIPGMLAAFFALWLIHPSPTLWYLGMVTILLSLPAGFVGITQSVLAGWEQAKRVSGLDLLSTLTPLFVLPFLHYGAISLIVANAAMAAFLVLVRLRWIRARVRITPTFHVRLWWEMIRGGAPFVVNSFVVSFYGFTSTFLLRHFTDDAAVGVFSQANRLFGTFLFIPTVVGYALLPALARLSSTNPQEFRAVQHRVLSLLIVISLPIMATMVQLAVPLCHLLYGPHKFVDLPFALQCYALVLIPMYIVSSMYQFLVAQNRNAIWCVYLAATIGLFALAGYVLIPWTLHQFHNGIVGAVLASFVAEGAAAIAMLMLLQLNPLTRELVIRFGRTLVATLAMMVVIWILRRFFIALPAVFGWATFVLLAWRLRVLTPEEQEQVRRVIRQKLRPLLGIRKSGN